MTKRPFRLTYINARRLYGVAGCDYLPAPACSWRRLTRLGIPRGPTEASRAIHECHHGSQTLERGGHHPRDDRNIFVFGEQHHRREQLFFGRPQSRREPRSLGLGITWLELHRSGRYNHGDGDVARLPEPSHLSHRHMELEQLRRCNGFRNRSRYRSRNGNRCHHRLARI